jgi:thiol-disulfide isomerase/thioredoxin
MLPSRKGGVAAFAAWLLAASVCRGTGGGEPAPRFNAKTLDRKKFDNRSIKGKVVLLELWTTWCHYCLEETPLVEKFRTNSTSRA